MTPPKLVFLLLQLWACTGLLPGPRSRRLSAPRCCAVETELRLVQSGAKRVARRLRLALKRENYASAGAFQRELQELRQRDPVWTLRVDLAAAVQTEDYAAASRLRSELAALRSARPMLLWRDELLVLGRDGRRLVAVGWDERGAQVRVKSDGGVNPDSNKRG